jgi:hypothetical protein
MKHGMKLMDARCLSLPAGGESFVLDRRQLGEDRTRPEPEES